MTGEREETTIRRLIVVLLRARGFSYKEIMERTGLKAGRIAEMLRSPRDPR